MDINNVKLQEKIDKVKFLLDDKELPLGDYEKISSDIFFSPQQSSKRNKLIIHPGGEMMLLVSIIISAFNDYIRNMIDPANNILEHLKDGDMVEINGYRASYRGVFNEKIKLEYADGTSYFPVDQSFKMIRYNGSATTINKMPTKKGTKTKETKNVVSSIFDIDTRDLSNIIKYSTVFVAPKEKIYEIIRNLKLVHENKKYEITTLFPFAYYSSNDHQLDFAGNATKIEPIIKFASRISVARDLVQDNKDIKNVIIFGEESYRNGFTDLDWLIKRRSIENVSVIVEWGKMMGVEGLLENVEGLEVYAWSQNAILNRVNLHNDRINPKRISNLSLIQSKVINNFVNKDIDLECISESMDIQDKLIEARRILKGISNNVVSNDEKDEFLKLSYTLINLYEKSCFPLKCLEEMVEGEQLIAVHPGQTMVRLNELLVNLETYSFDTNATAKAKSIVSILILLREELFERNPKWDELIKLLRGIQLKKSTIILYKGYFIEVLRRCLNLSKIPISFSMHTITKFNPDKIYDEVIIPGVYQGKNYDFINNSFAENIKVLAYQSEKSLYAWTKRYNKKLFGEIDRKNLLTEYSAEETATEIDAVVNEYVNDLMEIEDIISDINRRQGTFEGSFAGGTSKTECVKMAIFESGERAYFSRYFAPSLLDRSIEEIRDIKVEDLSIGDELIFKKGEKDMGKDIIQDIIEKLLENSDFNKQYKESLVLSRYWKIALDNFMKETGSNESYISFELAKQGAGRSPMAVSTWLRSNKTTAPDKENVYWALANIVKDKFFIEKWKEIYDACSVIRSLQTKLKKYLGKCIVKSVGRDIKSDFDKIVESCVGDVAKLAQIVQIEQLYDIQLEVPVYMTNRLIET